MKSKLIKWLAQYTLGSTSPHYEVDNGGEEEDYADHSSNVGQCTNASGSHVLKWNNHISTAWAKHTV